jgi:hypothetical protein
MWKIYVRVNVVNGLKYIGITSKTLDERWSISQNIAKNIKAKIAMYSHKRDTSRHVMVRNRNIEQLQKLERKGRLDWDLATLGEEAFTHHVLEEHECMVCGLLAEQRLIAEHCTRDKSIGYNHSKGGEIPKWITIDYILEMIELHKQHGSTSQ